MNTVEAKTLDFVNTGLGLVKAAQEGFHASVAQVSQKIENMRSGFEKSVADFKNQVEKSMLDLKVQGSLDNSIEAQKIRETAVSTVRKFK